MDARSAVGRLAAVIAASQTDSAVGAAGGVAGDFLLSLLLVPASTSPGAVSVKDGTGSAKTVFAGGASSLGDLKPFAVPICSKSEAGAWKVTTGASISVIPMGWFT